MQSFFDSLFSDFFLPHEKRLIAWLLALLIAVSGFVLGSMSILKNARLHYDRRADQIVLSIGNFTLHYPNGSLF